MAKTSSIREYWLNIKQAVRGGSKKIVVNNVRVSPTRRESQDIAKWRQAMKIAEGYTQQRGKLFDLYEDMILDGVLEAVMQKRIDRVTNRRLIFLKDDDSQDDDLTRLASKSFFEQLLVEIMNAKFWGHSLIELYWDGPGGRNGETLLVPRKNVKPRWGIVTEDEWGTEGIDYRSPAWSKNLIEVGGPESLGLLLKVSQYVIYKRGNFGDWAEFVEVFGMPFRWATYNNEASRAILEEALKEAGSAGYVVAPEDAKLQFHNGNMSGQGGEVFRQLRVACNEEITLSVLGNSMTTIEARSSGYAQSETQAEGEDELNMADRRYVLRILNEKLLPYLERLGYQVNGRWEFAEEDHLNLAQRVDVDTKLASVIDIAPDYFYEKYMIPKPSPEQLKEIQARKEEARAAALEAQKSVGNPSGEQKPKEKKQPPGKLNAPAEGVKFSRPEAVALYYQPHPVGCDCGSCASLSDITPLPNKDRIPARLEKAIAAAVWSGKLTADSTSKELHQHYYKRLKSAARTGFARSLDNAQDWTDFGLQQGLKRNLSAFAAAKQNALLEELNAIPRPSRQVFDKAARGILKRYHGSYLAAEMITLESAADTASIWRQFEEATEFYPHLKFTTSHDERVRESHAALDGAVYPVGHPFWDSHTPPLDWRCRCTVIQTDEPASSRDSLPARKGFGHNPYKTKRLVGEDHPYFQMDPGKLQGLLQVAEDLRAAIELKDVRKRALKQTGIVHERDGVQGVELTREAMEAIFDSASAGRGVRDALLSVLDWTVANATDSATAASKLFYQVDLLDYTFQLTLQQTATGVWSLSELRAI